MSMSDAHANAGLATGRLRFPPTVVRPTGGHQLTAAKGIEMSIAERVFVRAMDPLGPDRELSAFQWVLEFCAEEDCTHADDDGHFCVGCVARDLLLEQESPTYTPPVYTH